MLITSILMMTLGSVAGALDAGPATVELRYESQTCSDVTTERAFDAAGAEVATNGKATEFAGTRRTRRENNVEFTETESTRAGADGSLVKLKSSLRREVRNQGNRRFESLEWTTSKVRGDVVVDSVTTTEENEYEIFGEELILRRRILNGNLVDVQERVKESIEPGRREITTTTEGPYAIRTSADGGFSIVTKTTRTCVYEAPTS